MAKPGFKALRAVCKRPLPAIGAALVMIFTVAPRCFCQDTLVGQWTVTIVAPPAPGGAPTTSTLTFDVSPRGDSLVGRLTVTDSQGRVVGGVWRHVGKMISITYEPPCDQTTGTPCGTLILLGKMRRTRPSAFIKGRKLIVEWDSPNGQNPALFDTSNGKFSAVPAVE